ncbi:hypothetical protein HELRODRAFT_89299 [Helobdella robusta]|uniref:Ig-like domain-containing protein n=1 Tax=Helobdella robusta TaxID=6412 RepID=T1G7B8_HELRO|nr:hypothetical protein HELRODRAFT_89299 [Helobdella robusta]ESN93121.1 hypothetical protein HELRODRAFT_89299 [Helobdella robusta]
MYWFYFTFICFTTSDVLAQTSSCPKGCICEKTSVKCSFQQLTKVPENISDETTLLDLRFNHIEEILPGVFKNLKKLKTLLLNNNKISHLDDNTFEGLTELENLQLQKNEIFEISPMAFKSLKNLEQVHLQNNHIESLDKDTFKYFPKLTMIYLNNNELETLPAQIFSLNKQIKVQLNSNPFICDCQIAWFKDFFNENEIKLLECAEPPQHNGKLVFHVLKTLNCKKPRIASSPQNLNINPGEDASFQCLADGEPQPSIQWFHNKKDVSLENRSKRFEVLEDGSLLINQATVSDAGAYFCRATNLMGQDESNTAYLSFHEVNVLAAPQIVNPPENRTAIINEGVSMSCGTVGFPPPEIRWTHTNINNRDRLVNHDPRFTVDSSGTLHMSNLKDIDHGFYKCIASNIAGNATAIGRLMVYIPPEFTTKPTDQKIAEEHPVFFSCDVISEPLAKISWKKNGIDLTNTRRININPSGTTLTISSVKKSDEGNYECLASNSGGEASASARLTVMSISRPHITKKPLDINNAIGNRAKFDCVVGEVEPKPIIKWFKNGDLRPLTSSDKYEITENSSLIILEIDLTDEGRYECRAENIVGFDIASARLTITDARFRSITNQHINDTVTTVNNGIQEAIENTKKELYQKKHQPKSGHDLLKYNRYPNNKALSLSKAAEVFESTLERLYSDIHSGVYYNIDPSLNITYKELLNPAQLQLVSDLSGCRTHRRIIETCDDLCFHRKYRTFDGTCNNFKNAMSGSSLTPLLRLLPPKYENNFNLPVGWTKNKLYNGKKIPSARKISLNLISTNKVTADDEYTHMLMQWGQFLDHDLDFVPTAVSNARFSDGRFCNETCNSQSPCFPIPVSNDDPRVQNRRCIGFVRSSAMCGSGVTSALFDNNALHRQQLNMLTSYIDASNVYGSSEETAINLRNNTNEKGLLRIGTHSAYGFKKEYMPANRDEFVDCQVDSKTAHVPCFLAGDHRSNEQLGLLAMHTIWFREHNRLATKLSKMNSHWDSDTTYHETRKIVGAIMQHITYNDWLPKILGPYGMQMIGPYKGYNPSVNPTIANEFASAAFRFGHTMINPVLSRLNETFLPIIWGNLPLHKAFFAPFRIIEEGGIDPILRGLFGVAAKKLVSGEFLNSELTEKLFVMANEVAQDLAAFNIQRGRDHGLQSYNAYRKYCGMKEAKTFDDFKNEITDDLILKKLEELYEHPDNVDLFVGGVAENVMDNSRIGPTFVCIIADQFKRLRDGDRFWYENPEIFKPTQLAEIKKTSLARILCDNSDSIQEIQKDVFILAKYPDNFIKCDSDEVLKLDLKPWFQCCEGFLTVFMTVLKWYL